MNQGIAIDGPMDELILEGQGATLGFYRKPDAGFTPLTAEVPEKEHLGRETVTYYFTSLTALPMPGDEEGQTYGFWVLRDGSVLTAMSALAKRYTEDSTKDRLLEEAARMIWRLSRTALPHEERPASDLLDRIADEMGPTTPIHVHEVKPSPACNYFLDRAAEIVERTPLRVAGLTEKAVRQNFAHAIREHKK